MSVQSCASRAEYDVVFYDSVGSAMPGQPGQPMGGSERGLMVIAQALAERMHVAVISENAPPGVHAMMTSRDAKGHLVYYGQGGAAEVQAPTVVIHRYSRYPEPLSRAWLRRVFVLATDVGGEHHAHQEHLLGRRDDPLPATLVCVSSWQASTFPKHWRKIVLPPPLPDAVYDRPIPPKDPHKLVYASAAVKGLDATLTAWRRMKRHHPINTAAMKLHVAMGWGAPERPPTDPDVVYHGLVSPDELVALFDDAAGLFFVNTFPETFCAVAAIAEARGCAMHVYPVEGVGALHTTMRQGLCHDDDALYESVRSQLASPLARREARSFRLSTLTEAYERLFRFGDHGADGIGVTITSLENASEVPISTARDNLERRWSTFQGDVPEIRTGDRAAPPPFQDVILRDDGTISWAGEGGPVARADSPSLPKRRLDGRPSICLCMMAKNEAHAIGRALKSVAGIVDRYAILLDPTTTDRTREVILETIGPIAEGRIVELPWHGTWGEMRTKTLELGRESGADYLLVLDADDTLEGTLDLASLGTHDGYNLLVHDANIAYPRPHIFRANLPFFYDGVAHEYLTSKEPHGEFRTIETLKYVRGKQTRGPEKFRRAITILGDRLFTHPDDTRTKFYLAESYRDSGQILLAHAAFLDRARDKRGYDEERYWSYYQRGRLGEQLLANGEDLTVDAIVADYNLAFAVRPDRLEALGAAARFLTNQGRHAQAYVYAKAAAGLPAPTTARLFVEPSWHLWEAKFWLGTIAIHLGKKDEARRLFTELLASPELPADNRPIAERNLRCACEGLQVEAAFVPTPHAAAAPSGDAADSIAFFGELQATLKSMLTPGGSELGLALSLFSLVASTRARRVLEIGRFKGLSTLALAAGIRFVSEGWDEPDFAKQRPDVDYKAFEARERGLLISVDPHPLSEVPELLRKAHVDSYVTLLNERSDAPGVLALEGDFDLIFIDGDHSFEGCLADVERFAPYVRPGGYMVLHDYFGWYTDGKNGSPVKRVANMIARRSIEPRQDSETHTKITAGNWEHLLIDTGYASLVVFRRPKAEAP